MQTNAEKAEAIARRKQKDRDRAAYKAARLGPRYSGPAYQCPYAEETTWEEALEALPMDLRVLVSERSRRVTCG